MDASELDTARPPPAATLDLSRVGAALALLTRDGRVKAVSPSARQLLERAGVALYDLPSPLPRAFWRELMRQPAGRPQEWRPGSVAGLCLGWTRYAHGDDELLVSMSEISEVQELRSRRLQQQRLEAIGRLSAGIAHDLRTPLSSIMFTTSVLENRLRELSEAEMLEALSQIREATERMRESIAGLLDYARVHPRPDAESQLDVLFARVCSLLRPLLRDTRHRVVTRIEQGANRVRGNPLVVEQILVNLVTNAVEAATEPLAVELRSTPGEHGRDVVIHVTDDGPGVDAEAREAVFDPFFTTKSDGTGLGLTISREAAVSLGGQLELLPSDRGCHFRLTLPRPRSSTRPPDDAEEAW